jgi:5-hydroxyisourate hydrolase-like protein (transthyretin family)
MRVNKIVPFSVVILLITVSFAGIAAAAAPSEVGAIGTQLTATATPTTAPVNTNFAISGTLSVTGGTGIPGATIQLQNSTDNATWTNVTTAATNVTDANGNYQLSNNESVAGTYYYRTSYASYGQYYANATSNVVSVTVTNVTTQLTAVATPTTAPLNTAQFTINGTFSNATSSAAIPGATITLQSSTDNKTWTPNVATNVTDSNGNYSFSQSESALGTYYFRTTYAGSPTYTNATSNVVSVIVTPIATTLNATASVSTVNVSVPFTISGTLSENTSGNGISGQTITLQENESGTWTTVNTTTTNSSGFYQFTLLEPVAGTYQYRTTYDGNTVYSNAISLVVTVQVGTQTTLTAAANVSTTTVNTNFTISGTLTQTSSGAPIGPDAIITLQQNESGTWTNIANTTTDSGGNYSFSQSQSAPGTYEFRTTYAGDGLNLSAATSNVVSVNVSTTRLSIAASVPSTEINTNFTINGTLYPGVVDLPAGIANATITLQSSTDNATWSNVGTNVTIASGFYQFNQSEPTLNTYYYQTTYAGTSSILPATSNEVTVTVTSGPLTTTLTATPSVTSTTVNTTFTISGTLTTTSGGIANATITLNGTNTTTNSSGNYSFSLSESTPGTYQFQTTYAGNATYTNATSNTVRVTVNLIVTPTSSPAIVDSLFLFVRGSDNALWYKTWNGATWSNATSLGGTLTSSPAATSPSSGVINVFVQGTTGTVYEKTTTNSGTTWSGWTSLGGVLAAGSSPAATSPSTGVIDVFAQGTTAAVYEKTSSDSGATWSGWTSLGGVLAANSGPAATSSGSVTYVFAHGTDNAVWYKDWNGTAWSSWNSLGGVLAAGSSPAATSPASSAIDVFAQSTNGAVYEKTTANGGTTWGGWASLGGVLAAGSSPAATSESGQVYIAALGTGNVLWWKTTTSSWMSVGGI